MSKVMKRAPGVDMVLLRRHFVVFKRSQWVVVAPGVSVVAADEVPIFECLAAGWVDDDDGLFLLLD